MSIRDATRADLSAIVEMSRKFYSTTTYAEYARFNADTVRNLAALLIDSGVILIAEQAQRVVGMVGLLITPHPFSGDVKIAAEIVWWVEPDARNTGAGIELLKAVEPACKAHDVVAIQMVHLNNSPPQAALLYERHGYIHSESSYTKALSWQ